MSSTYTPTADEVREKWASSVEEFGTLRGLHLDYEDALLAFDRYLAAHDAEVAAKAWDEGAERATEFERGWLHAVRNGETVPQRPQNPYRKAVQS